MSERDSAPWDAWRNAEAEVRRLKAALAAAREKISRACASGGVISLDSLVSRLKETEKALAAEREAHTGTKARYDKLWNSDANADVRAERERSERLRGAILWALGEQGEFGSRPFGRGAYWWRTELRVRAGALRDTAPEEPA